MFCFRNETSRTDGHYVMFSCLVNRISQLALCFVFLFGAFAATGVGAATHKENVGTTSSCLTNGDVLISTIIDALSIETTNPSNTISKIKIFDTSMTTVYVEDGCHTNHCTVSTENLTPGRYLVEVVILGVGVRSQWVNIT